MAGHTPANSVWSAMAYTPPRGRCNFKTSLMSPACPCLRFMLHPVKAATSFECDGCNHHASFHSLENPAEDAVLRKWAQQQAEDKEIWPVTTTKKKRKLITQSAAPDEDGAKVFTALAGNASKRGTTKPRQARRKKADDAASLVTLDSAEE